MEQRFTGLRHKDKIKIKDLLVQGIVGVNTRERHVRQNILINLTMFHDVTAAATKDDVKHTINYSQVYKAVLAYTEDSHHYTLESLAFGIAEICCLQFDVSEVVVKVAKPCVLSLAHSPSVTIRRTREELLAQSNKRSSATPTKAGDERTETLKEKTKGEEKVKENDSEEKEEGAHVLEAFDQRSKERSSLEAPKKRTEEEMKHTAFIALGSNLSSREEYFLIALNKLREFAVVLCTSQLYETAPAYVLDQPSFLNAVCKVKVDCSADQLLRRLKRIESEMGRKESIRYGPRCIDLDILFYDDVHIHTEELTIPHSRLPERDFILGPLCDIAPDHMHPVLKKTVSQLLKELGTAHELRCTIPIRFDVHQTPEQRLAITSSSSSESNGDSICPRAKFWFWKERTYIMGILNITPDSFSDGGDHLSIEAALQRAKQMLVDGVDILDIGGQSTRPNATHLTAEEELDRVLPVIKAIRQTEELKDVPISVDTFYAEVAEESIKAGANIINDVSAGSFDEKMFAVAAKYQVPIVLMHMRGTPQTMMDKAEYDNVLEEVSSYLKARAQLAERSFGIPRWNIILDPGIGFAKKAQHSLTLLRRLKELKEKTNNYPILVGASRKGFIGGILQQAEPKKRGWGTAATSVAAVAGGANILRVHDVKEQRDVILVADAIYSPYLSF
ncbi:trifunctional dihydropteroate synthetase [Balamuthia mandrillaris]